LAREALERKEAWAFLVEGVRVLLASSPEFRERCREMLGSGRGCLEFEMDLRGAGRDGAVGDVAGDFALEHGEVAGRFFPWPSGITYANEVFYVLDSYHDEVFTYTAQGARHAEGDFPVVEYANDIAYAHGWLYVLTGLTPRYWHTPRTDGERQSSTTTSTSTAAMKPRESPTRTWGYSRGGGVWAVVGRSEPGGTSAAWASSQPRNTSAKPVNAMSGCSRKRSSAR